MAPPLASLVPDKTEIEVRWLTNQAMDHFILTWVPAHGNDVQPAMLPGDETEYTITGLSPSTLYTVYLYAGSAGANDGTLKISSPDILTGTTCKYNNLKFPHRCCISDDRLHI